MRAERIACAWLRKKGYVIEAVNERFPVGEIDIIAQEGTVLCFVEVRSATSFAFGGVLVSITGRKKQCLIRAAQWYLKKRRTQPETVRFDVVAIDWGKDAAPVIKLVQGAFNAD